MAGHFPAILIAVTGWESTLLGSLPGTFRVRARARGHFCTYLCAFPKTDFLQLF